MTVSTVSTPETQSAPIDASVLERLPVTFRKLLRGTPEKDWAKLRGFLIESEEAGQLVDMLPEMTRVMKYCPARLLGRVGRREIRAEELDQAYTKLHDSLHGVRKALHGLLLLAGLVGDQPGRKAALAPQSTRDREPSLAP